MEKLLLKLDEGCRTNPGRYIFNAPASKKDITLLEKALGIKLPASYKKFLMCFNGGFICDQEVGGDEGMSVADAAWNSNFLHGLGDIKAAFTRKEGRWKQSGSKACYIPFCSTGNQETLVFRNPLDEHGESPVIDAWHEAPPAEWEAVYKDFTELLRDYVNNEGEIKTIG
jgi:hypothetical protein